MDLEEKSRNRMYDSKRKNHDNLYSNNEIEARPNGNNWIGTIKEDMVNSQGPNAQLLVQSITKKSVAGSEVEIMDGGQLFKKKNRASNRVAGGINAIPYNN